MDQSGTSEVEQRVEGESGAAGEAVQFDLFGMPVDAAALKGDDRVKQSRESAGTTGTAAAAGATGVDADAQQTVERATSPANAAATPAAMPQPERRRQPRANKAASASSLWQEEETPAPDDAITTSEANTAPVPADAPKKRRTREILAAQPSPELARARGTPAAADPPRHLDVVVSGLERHRLRRRVQQQQTVARRSHGLRRASAAEDGQYRPVVLSGALGRRVLALRAASARALPLHRQSADDDHRRHRARRTRRAGRR